MTNVLKSKTVNFNLIVPAVVAILTTVGVKVPVEVVTGILAIGNFILRLITKKPIAEK